MTRTAEQYNASTADRQSNGAVIHVRFGGRSFDLPLAGLEVSRASSERQVKQALSVFLEVPVQRLNEYVVDWHANGNLTLRPQAVFG